MQDPSKFAAVLAPVASADSAAAPSAAAPEEEKKEEPAEDTDEDMGFGLFD